MLEKVSKKTYFILLLLVLLVVCVNSLSLFQTSLPVGIDGYYYVLQIDAFRESGQFYFSTSTPLVLFFLNVLNTFFGNPVLSIKIGSLFLFVMLLSGIFASVLFTTRDGWSANSAVAIAALSNLHFFYLAEFINNLGSLAFILFGIVALLVFEEKRTKTWLFVSVSAFSAAVFSHRSAIIIISAILFWMVIVFLFQKLGSRGWGPLVALCAVLFVSPLILNYISIVDLPETLSSELVSTLVSPFTGYGVPEKWMLLIALCLFIAHLENFSSIVQRNRSYLLLPVVLLPASFIGLNPFLNHSVGVQSVTGRFDTLLFIAVAVVIPLLIMTIAESSLKFAKITAMIFGALILWSALAFPYPKGLSREFILAREGLDNELPRFSKFPCNNPVVIASHGKQFHVSKELKVASQQRPALETKFGCTLWLIDYDDRHSLIEDSELKYLLESLNNEERKMLFEKNAHLEGLFVTR